MASVFADTKIFNYWRVRIQLENKLVGGVPKDPKTIEGWLRTKLDTKGNDKEHRLALLSTMQEIGLETTGDETLDELVEMENTYRDVISGEVTKLKHTVGFKKDSDGLNIKGRQVKAALKESSNIMFGGERAGPTRKGFKNYVAERVIVVEDVIHLNREAPDGLETITGHVPSPQGPKSTLTNYEYVERPILTFHIKELKVMQKSKDGQPALTDDQWRYIWSCAEQQGLGAVRSQGHGRFEVIEWEPVKVSDLPDTGSVAKSVEEALLADTAV